MHTDKMKTDHQMKDIDIIHSVLEGNLDDYEFVIRRYNRFMYRIVRGLTRDHDEALDIVQEAHIQAFKKLSSFIGPEGFSTWLASITRNIALMRLRKSRRIDYTSEENMFEDSNDDSKQVSQFDEIDQLQTRASLESLINLLPSKYRLVFILRAIECMSISQTASLLELDKNLVKTRYHRAKSMLKVNVAKLLEQQNITLYEFAGENCDKVTHGVLKAIKQLNKHTGGSI
jgi:RNA polymerase sigma-70 factor (ECF subfamily)